jgi:hypothetical protein
MQLQARGGPSDVLLCDFLGGVLLSRQLLAAAV